MENSKSDYAISVLTNWNIFLENRPKVDMPKCVPGQKLLTSKGGIVKYIEHQPEYPYPHKIEYQNGSFGGRTDEGWMYRTAPLPTDHDIVYIFPVEN